MQAPGPGRLPLVMLGLAVALFAAIPDLGAASSDRLSGRVLDSLGNAVANAEVLLVRPSGAWRPIAAARSNAEGRFVLEEPAPGAYRIAALADGYRTFVGRVDTLLERSVRVVLEPALAHEGSPAPADDPDWALRLPRRSLLRDVEPTAIESASAEPGPSSPTVRLDQIFSFPAELGESESGTSELEASRTAMLVETPLGDHASMLVEGHRERSATGGLALDDGAPGGARESGSAVRVGFDWDAGRAGDLAMAAYWSASDYLLMDHAPLVDHERRVLGYDADWSRRLDDGSRVTVALDYVDSLLARDTTHHGSPQDLTNRAISAAGSWRRPGGALHDIEVALEASHVQWPRENVIVDVEPAEGHGSRAATPAAVAVLSASTLADEGTWGLELRATDRWSLGGGFRLLYGVGLRQERNAASDTVVVPRLGGVWESGRTLRLSGVVSWHDEISATGGEELGYEASLRVPVAPGVALEGGTRYTPTTLGSYGGPGAEPLYLTDGSAAVREHHLALAAGRRGTRGWVELARGDAQGALAVLVPWDLPLLLAMDRRLRYDDARAGLRFGEQGTDLSVQYRRVAAAEGTELHDAASEQSWVELSLRQDLRLLPTADWRLLMAVRFGSVDAESLATQVAAEDLETLDDLNRRLSAGVSVVF